MSFVDQILSFEKEDLLDILHYLVKEVTLRTERPSIRVYLEDMRGGALSCLYTSDGELERKGARIPIQRRDNALVRSYLESTILDGIVLGTGTDDLHREWYAKNKQFQLSLFQCHVHHEPEVRSYRYWRRLVDEFSFQLRCLEQLSPFQQ